MTQDNNRLSQPLTLGLALIGGIGLVLMMVALGVGVAQPDADPGVFYALLLLGVVALAFAIGGWFVTVRPSANFDDINIPRDIHTHEEGHDAGSALVIPGHADDHDKHGALVIDNSGAAEPHATSHS